jgi:hypothetical protein
MEYTEYVYIIPRVDINETIGVKSGGVNGIE